MGLWVSILVTLIVFGSILWIQPSPRDKMLTQLRSNALSKGLKVRLLDEKLSAQLFPWIDSYQQFVIYEKTLPKLAKPKSHKAIVVRITDDPNAHEIDQVNPIKSLLLDKLDFKLLPRTSEALIISVSGISIVWREYKDDKGNALHQLELINDFLEQCITHSDIWT